MDHVEPQRSPAPFRAAEKVYLAAFREHQQQEALYEMLLELHTHPDLTPEQREECIAKCAAGETIEISSWYWAPHPLVRAAFQSPDPAQQFADQEQQAMGTMP
jgi:hypothetical protein